VATKRMDATADMSGSAPSRWATNTAIAKTGRALPGVLLRRVCAGPGSGELRVLGAGVMVVDNAELLLPEGVPEPRQRLRDHDRGDQTPEGDRHGTPG
jgi:hypothetical protein